MEYKGDEQWGGVFIEPTVILMTYEQIRDGTAEKAMELARKSIIDHAARTVRWDEPLADADTPAIVDTE